MNKFSYTLDLDLDIVADFLGEEGNPRQYVNTLMKVLGGIVYDKLVAVMEKREEASEDEEVILNFRGEELL